MIVSPTRPVRSHLICHPVTRSKKHMNPGACKEAWLEEVSKALEKFAIENKEVNLSLGRASWTAGGTWENSGLTLLMMTENPMSTIRPTKCYFLWPTGGQPPPREEVRQFERKLPEFIVTVPTVSLQQRRGCCCSNRLLFGCH
eukprot:GHVU01111849.1.p4 GENE.GHVU01111849.1~~GHVU01111849.1.p4  ORF type:complete len:143 (-),score=11.45 GHVU01111849.1:1491-1919(-)